MRRASLVVFIPLLMGSGPCDDGSTSPATDASAGAAGTTGGGASCDKFEPIEQTAARFQGKWLLDAASVNGACSNQYVVSFEPWPFNPAAAPQDPSPEACPEVFLTITPKVLSDACTASATCPSEQAASGIFVHPWPKIPSDFGPGPLADVIAKGAGDQAWTKTSRSVGINKKDPTKMSLDDKFYTRTTIDSGTCTPAP